MSNDPRPADVRVSVIVPVWNVEPWLRECLDSVVNQTIGLDRLEVLAVDDGSTDASGRILDEYAARYPQVRVFHEPGSGGPGRPRNVGLDHATGTYVFFLDSDDYLGVEALERLVAMAERNASDIVLGKLVGVEGRKMYRSTGVFRRNADRASLEQVYRSGNVLKLFRRSFVERVGIRFREGIAGGEDGDFMARMYFEATTISVVADYDCYFARRRPGSQTRRHDRADDLADYIFRLERERIMAVAANRKAGIGRDVLMVRHIKKIASKFGRRWRALDAAERKRVFEAGAAVVGRWHTDLIQRALPAWAALRIYCLQRGLLAELEDIVACPVRDAFRDPFVERGRVFARFPHFRDAAGIPDGCFDITGELAVEQRLRRAVVTDGRLELDGEAHLSLVGGTTTVELRRWPRGRRLRFPTTVVATPELRDGVISYPAAGFEARIDLATADAGHPLRAGTWSIWVAVGPPGVSLAAPLRVSRGPAPGRGAGRQDRAARARLHVTPARELRLRIGRAGAPTRLLERAEASFVRGRRLLDRLMTRSRAGRLLAMAMTRARRGVRSRPASG